VDPAKVRKAHEDQPLQIEIKVAVEHGCVVAEDVGTLPLGGVRCLF
jgi:hypothetical protein